MSIDGVGEGLQRGTALIHGDPKDSGIRFQHVNRSYRLVLGGEDLGVVRDHPPFNDV